MRKVELFELFSWNRGLRPPSREKKKLFFLRVFSTPSVSQKAFLIAINCRIVFRTFFSPLLSRFSSPVTSPSPEYIKGSFGFVSLESGFARCLDLKIFFFLLYDPKAWNFYYTRIIMSLTRLQLKNVEQNFQILFYFFSPEKLVDTLVAESSNRLPFFSD